MKPVKINPGNKDSIIEKEISAKAHEIKNLLSGISGAITVLFEDAPDDDPDREIINEVLSKTERLDKVIKEMLNYIKSVRENKNA